MIKKEPKRCPIKLYVCQGPVVYGGVQTSLEQEIETPGIPKMPVKAQGHSKPEHYEKLFVFDEKNKDYPYMHSLANNGVVKVEKDEEEISNSDIS